MPQIALPDSILITSKRDLQQVVHDLARQPYVAVDTESNSLYAYQEQVCLIQFSSVDTDYLVDPLAIDDLTGLKPIFQDPGIVKVFHAAEYDLICLKRDFGFEFANLFDTMVAARILGRKEVGLGSLLEVEFGVHLNKRYQRANWGQRPLPLHLLNYARLDTHYLIPLRQILVDSLDQKHLSDLAEEDNNRMCTVTPGLQNGTQKNGINPWKVRGAYDLNPQQAAILLYLCEYRDKVARAINKPLFKVLSDQTLVNIAMLAPLTLSELGSVEGLSSRQVKRHGAEILQAVERGRLADPIYPPVHKKPGDDYTRRLEGLRQWRKITARKLGVDSDVVLPRDVMYDLAGSNPVTTDELQRIMRSIQWRYEKFGTQILKVLSDG
jgi:ribonuclease D